jgi:hypothetical protein
VSEDEWPRRLRGAGWAVKAAVAAVDEAFAHLDGTIRAAHRAGMTLPEIIVVTSLSKAKVDEAAYATGAETVDLPHGTDTSLRIATYTAAAAVADLLAVRARRDALVLEAGVASGLPFSQIAATAGASRRYEWQLRTGRLSVDRRSKRQDVFEGAGLGGYRAAENARLRDRRARAKEGADVTEAHGLHGYRLGCRCDLCVAARRGVQDGTVPIRHGLDGYRHGCRCEVCCDKHAGYHRQWRRRRKTTG